MIVLSYSTKPSPAEAGFPDVTEYPRYTTCAFHHRDRVPELDLPVNTTGDCAKHPIAETQGQFGVRRWTLSLPISVPPNLLNPTLELLTYDIKYVSWDVGYAFVQTDIVLSDSIEATEGITTDPAKLPFYSFHEDEKPGDDNSREGYAPPMLNETVGLGLSSRLSFKSQDITGCCHYAHREEISPNSYLNSTSHAADAGYEHSHPPQPFLFFHVYENSCAKALRNIHVNVEATWSGGTEPQEIEEAREIRRGREGLMIAMGEEGWKVKRPEEAIEPSENGSDVDYKRLRDTVGSQMPDEAESRAKRDNLVKAGAESAMVRMFVEIQKFSEDVERYREEEAEIRKQEEMKSKDRMENEFERLMETERKAREEEYDRRAQTGREMTSELMKIQGIIHQGIDQYRREEVENRARMETKAKEVERLVGEAVERRVKEELEHREREAERQAKEEADRKADEERERKERVRAKREEAEWRRKVFVPRMISEAPDVAEGKFEEHLKQTFFESKGLTCSEKSGWVKRVTGYRCANVDPSHSSHFVTFSALGLK